MIIVACDGIWDCLTNEKCFDKINEYIKKDTPDDKNYHKPVEKLLDDILAPNTDDGIGCDNMTAILIKIHST